MVGANEWSTHHEKGVQRSLLVSEIQHLDRMHEVECGLGYGQSLHRSPENVADLHIPIVFRPAAFLTSTGGSQEGRIPFFQWAVRYSPPRQFASGRYIPFLKFLRTARRTIIRRIDAKSGELLYKHVIVDELDRYANLLPSLADIRNRLGDRPIFSFCGLYSLMKIIHGSGESAQIDLEGNSKRCFRSQSSLMPIIATFAMHALLERLSR